MSTYPARRPQGCSELSVYPKCISKAATPLVVTTVSVGVNVVKHNGLTPPAGWIAVVVLARV